MYLHQLGLIVCPFGRIIMPLGQMVVPTEDRNGLRPHHIPSQSSREAVSIRSYLGKHRANSQALHPSFALLLTSPLHLLHTRCNHQLYFSRFPQGRIETVDPCYSSSLLFWI